MLNLSCGEGQTKSSDAITTTEMSSSHDRQTTAQLLRPSIVPSARRTWTSATQDTQGTQDTQDTRGERGAFLKSRNLRNTIGPGARQSDKADGGVTPRVQISVRCEGTRTELDSNAQILRIVSCRQGKSVRNLLERQGSSFSLGVIDEATAHTHDASHTHDIMDDGEDDILYTAEHTIFSNIILDWPLLQATAIQCMVILVWSFLTWGLAFSGVAVGASFAAASS